MGESLGEVSQGLAAMPGLFRIEAEMVGEPEHPLEKQSRFLEPRPVVATGSGQRLDQPKRADVEGAFLYALDLIELNGDDLRRDPLEVRKATLRSMLAKVGLGLRFNEYIEGDGPTIFAHACKMGLEGIVSKRKGSTYHSGRSPDWLKMKNPAAPAVTREAEEDWTG